MFHSTGRLYDPTTNRCYHCDQPRIGEYRTETGTHLRGCPVGFLETMGITATVVSYGNGEHSLVTLGPYDDMETAKDHLVDWVRESSSVPGSPWVGNDFRVERVGFVPPSDEDYLAPLAQAVREESDTLKAGYEKALCDGPTSKNAVIGEKEFSDWMEYGLGGKM